jgi:hypothetical protein
MAIWCCFSAGARGLGVEGEPGFFDGSASQPPGLRRLRGQS